jgi:hypothetical protein
LRLIVLAASALALVAMLSPAQGRPHHRHHLSARMPQAASTRPQGCPRAWCGCWLMQRLGLTDRALWQARQWAHVGAPAAGPAPGVIAVWPHHVGQITSVTGPHSFVMISGNDGHAVRERERSSRGVIAYRKV